MHYSSTSKVQSKVLDTFVVLPGIVPEVKQSLHADTSGIRADVLVWCICSWTECNMEVNLEMQGDWMKVGLPALFFCFIAVLPAHVSLLTTACSTGSPINTLKLTVDGRALALMHLLASISTRQSSCSSARQTSPADACIICYVILHFTKLTCIQRTHAMCLL